MKFSFKMEGLKELDAALAEFRPMTGRNILRRAGTQAMEPVADEMRAKAPVQRGHEQDLKKSIDTGTKGAKSAKREFRDTHVVEVYAGPSVVGDGVLPQAYQQEFGNENHGPQPYVRPGWDVKRSGVMPDLKDRLGTELDKASKRAARRALKAKG